MATHPPSRLVGGLLALAFAVTVSGWLGASLAAQKKEEEEPAKPAKPKRPPEVEEEGPARPHKVINVDDEEPTPSKPRRKPVAPQAQAQTSIVEALRETKNPELQALYGELKVPHDAVTVPTLAGQTRTLAIEPLSEYYPDEKPVLKNDYIEVWSYDAEWRRSSNGTKYRTVLRIRPYEEIVLEAVDAFLKKDAGQLRLTRAEMLKAAETVLAAADRFHASGRETGARRGDAWQSVGKGLHQRLFEVQRERLQAFVTAGDWDGAADFARALAAAYRDPGDRDRIADPLVRMIRDGLPDKGADEGQLRKARDRIQQLEEIFPGSQAAQPVAGRLRGQAQALLEDAKRLRGEKKIEEARLRMQLAADICPTLPNLAEEMTELDKSHPVLRVGVRELPISMIPGQAATDADRRAIELLYEGLVKPRVLPGVGQRYLPALAGGAPRLIPLGRDFRIARGATWSDGTPVTFGDVKETLRAMHHERWVGYSPLWNRLMEDAEGSGDSFRLSLRLSQGYLDPLALMSFKVMPQSALHQGPRPNGKPLGSGPFVYRRAGTDLGRRSADFIANPAYSSREGKFGLPRVREIHFILFATEADDPAEALRKGQIDLVLDLSAPKARDLRDKAGDLVVRGPMPNRRVYFLAVNHRVARISGNVFLRRALASAVDRQALLNKHFREAPKANMHHSLNGPFPAGSWPCEPKNVPAELYKPEEARAQARKAVEQAGGPIRLKVKYPAGDSAARSALQDLCTSVNRELRIDDNTFIELALEEPGAEPQKLREDVEQSHQYELAYYHYDHPSEAYWVAPLFDMGATDMNGSNYLGYIDPQLQAQLEQAKNRRDFKEVQEAMRIAHGMLEQKMPLIPLWQLDTYLAHRPWLDLRGASVDPLLIFDDVEQWKMEKKQ